MIDLNNPESLFRTEKQVEAYSKFFLSVNPIDSEQEFRNDEEIKDFNTRRERLLKTQLNFLGKVDFSKANVARIEGPYFKIVKKRHSAPLSAEGATKGSSRFNYKEIIFLKNRSIYFGKTKICSEIEKFHLEYHREMIRKAFDSAYKYQEGEIAFDPHWVKQYNVSLDNVLVLTSKPSLDAIGISTSAFMNEWYDINEEYEVPTSSQILGAIARVNGFKGILYKSIRHQIDSNLVIFEENSGELIFAETESLDYVPSSELIVKAI